MASVIEYEDFYAHCNHMPGSEKKLCVGGTIVFPTSGWSATLKRREASPRPSPLTLELELDIEAPAPGTPIIEKLTPVALEELCIDPGTEYEDVYIFGDEEYGEGPGQVELQHPTTGAG